MKKIITASRKDIYLVLVYSITECPMTLATNKESLQKFKKFTEIQEDYY